MLKAKSGASLYPPTKLSSSLFCESLWRNPGSAAPWPDRCLGSGAAVRGEGGLGAVHEEPGALHLAHVVEAHHADVRVGEGAAAGDDLGQHLVGVAAAEHGQLPHRPVAVVVVAGRHGAHADRVGVRDDGLLGGRELNAGDHAVAGEVVHLAGDRVGREGRQVRQRLEELVVERLPHPHHGGGGGVRAPGGLGLGGDGHDGRDGGGDGEHGHEVRLGSEGPLEISSYLSFLYPAVSQSILFTPMQICFTPKRLINRECWRVWPWISPALWLPLAIAVVKLPSAGTMMSATSACEAPVIMFLMKSLCPGASMMV